MSEKIKVPELKFKKRESVRRDIGGDDGEYKIKGVLVEPNRDKWFYTVKGNRFDNIKIYGRSDTKMRFNKKNEDEESLIAGNEYEIEKPDMKFDKREIVERNIAGDDGEYRIQGVLVVPDRNKWFYTVKGNRFDSIRIFDKYGAESGFSKIE